MWALYLSLGIYLKVHNKQLIFHLLLCKVRIFLLIVLFPQLIIVTCKHTYIFFQETFSYFRILYFFVCQQLPYQISALGGIIGKLNRNLQYRVLISTSKDQNHKNGRFCQEDPWCKKKLKSTKSSGFEPII